MKVRAFATVFLIAIGGFLGGCAGTPDGRASDNWDAGNRPQMVLPGAIRSDVKGLAMGAARSKGWTIVKSTDDLLVMERPLDPASPSAASLGAANSVIPPRIEVTSAFIEQADGVKVALGAEAITQAPGEKSPKRTDFTETYREVLDRSLESLRANWTANRQRLATAIPPLPGPSESAPPLDSEKANSTPAVRTWAEEAAADEPKTPAPGAAPEPWAAATPAAPKLEPAETRRPTTPTAQEPEPKTAGGPAPVVDGSQTLSQRRVDSQSTAVRDTPAPSAILPPAEPEPVAPGDNMLTLSQASGTGAWAYYAEQYARLRGCNVTDQGAQLIESRSDGEIHKVACTGANSYLLKCQNGVCRSLE